MGQKSLIASHPERLDMERRYLQGESIAKIAKDYQVSYASLYEHCKHGLSRQMLQAFKKKQVSENLNLMQEFTTLMQDIKQMIAEFKAKKQHGLTLKATDTLIKLYQTMCQFASVFYQAQAEEQSMDKEQIRQEIENENQEYIKEMLEVLTKTEKSLLHMINAKMVTMDRSIVVLPDHATDSELLEKIRGFMPYDFTEKKPLRRKGRELSYPEVERSPQRTKWPANSEKPSEAEPEPIDPELEKMKVRPVPGIVIPSSLTDDEETIEMVRKQIMNIPDQRRE